MLDSRNWQYTKDDNNLIVQFGVSGDDIPMNFLIMADIERQLIRLISPLSYKMPEDKRMEGAIMTSIASYAMADGYFDYDVSEGAICFRMTAAFMNSTVSEELFEYLIDCSCYMVDEYNDKFLAVGKGVLSIQDFIESIQQ